MTLFGETRPIGRARYHGGDSPRGHYPFDDRLGLVGRYTPAVVHETIRFAVRHPFAEASAESSRTCGFTLSADTMRRLVGGTVPSMRAFGSGEPADPDPGPRERCDLVYVTADGTGVPLRRRHLRGAKGKNGAARTREVKAGAVFAGSTTYVATTHRKGKFAKLLRREFDRRHPLRPRTTVFLSDGAAWLESIRSERFPFATPVLDFHHAVEHLKPLMLGLGFAEESKEYRRKHRYWTERIRLGRIKGVLASVERDFGDGLVGDAKREYEYFRHNAERMKYDEYRANGWFIGTGVIESACKTVVGGRLKCPGMIWSLRGLKALLPLRTLHKSDRLEEFFRNTIKDLAQVRCA